MLKKREVFETSDGAIFKTKQEAIKHEIELDIINYGEHYALDMSSIDAVLNWMVQNPGILTQHLKQLL